VARALNMSSEFGKQIDSLCDVVSFVVAPAVFAYSVGLQQPWFLAVEAFYVLAGIVRLARYNVTGTTDGGRYFEGLPVPVSTFIVPVYFLFSWAGWDLQIWGVFFLVHAVLMISTVKVPKP
jgi:CDP-diacylglycerol---serine O-phosphatidyltransferase